MEQYNEFPNQTPKSFQNYWAIGPFMFIGNVRFVSE